MTSEFTVNLVVIALLILALATIGGSVALYLHGKDGAAFLTLAGTCAGAIGTLLANTASRAKAAATSIQTTGATNADAANG